MIKFNLWQAYNLLLHIFYGGMMMTIRFEGYIDQEGSISLTTPQWFAERVIKAVEEEFDVKRVSDGQGQDEAG